MLFLEYGSGEQKLLCPSLFCASLLNFHDKPIFCQIFESWLDIFGAVDVSPLVSMSSIGSLGE